MAEGLITINDKISYQDALPKAIQAAVLEEIESFIDNFNSNRLSEVLKDFYDERKNLFAKRTLFKLGKSISQTKKSYIEEIKQDEDRSRFTVKSADSFDANSHRFGTFVQSFIYGAYGYSMSGKNSPYAIDRYRFKSADISIQLTLPSEEIYLNNDEDNQVIKKMIKNVFSLSQKAMNLEENKVSSNEPIYKTKFKINKINKNSFSGMNEAQLFLSKIVDYYRERRVGMISCSLSFYPYNLASTPFPKGDDLFFNQLSNQIGERINHDLKRYGWVKAGDYSISFS